MSESDIVAHKIMKPVSKADADKENSLSGEVFKDNSRSQQIAAGDVCLRNKIIHVFYN